MSEQEAEKPAGSPLVIPDLSEGTLTLLNDSVEFLPAEDGTLDNLDSFLAEANFILVPPQLIQGALTRLEEIASYEAAPPHWQDEVVMGMGSALVVYELEMRGGLFENLRKLDPDLLNQLALKSTHEFLLPYRRSLGSMLAGKPNLALWAARLGWQSSSAQAVTRLSLSQLEGRLLTGFGIGLLTVNNFFNIQPPREDF